MAPEVQRRLDQLIGGHLDGALDAAQVAELAALLAADGEARRAFARSLAYDTALPRLAQRRARPLLLRWWPALAAAALLMVGIGLWSGGTAPTGPQLAGEGALVVRAGGELAAAAAGPLRAGDLVRTRSAAAVLRWPGEDTRIELAAGGELEIAAAGPAKDLLLRRGRVAVDAAHQQDGRRLDVRTDRLAVAVVGTRFTVARDAAGSTVAVEQGTVAVSAGGERREVAAGGLAMVGIAGGLQVMPAAPAGGGATLVRLDPAAWQAARGQGWTGTLGDDGLVAAAVDATAERVAVPIREAGYARLRPDMTIAVDATLARPGTLAVFLICRQADGRDWLGNYAVSVELPAGRHQRTWSLGDLRVEKGAALAQALGARISGVAVGAWNRPTGLVVHSCTVGAPAP
jgi:ferric-dicitrate binding protein FerR (iron transport regulator)